MGVTVIAACLIGMSLAAGGDPEPDAARRATTRPVRLRRHHAAGRRGGHVAAQSVAAGVLDLAGDPVEWGRRVTGGSADVARHRGPVQVIVDEGVVGWADGPALGGPIERVLEPGARMAVVGPSGPGKSTLLLTLAGLLAPRSARSCAPMSTGSPSTPLRRRCTAPRMPTCSPRRCGRTCSSVGDATYPEMIDALRAVGLGSGYPVCPMGSTPFWSAGQLRCRVVSGADCCWLERCSTLRRSSCSTSRPSTWMRPIPMRCCVRRWVICSVRARTVVVVTHHLPPDLKADLVVGQPA